MALSIVEKGWDNMEGFFIFWMLKANPSTTGMGSKIMVGTIRSYDLFFERLRTDRF